MSINTTYLCYIITNDDNKSYIGCTNNFKRRLRQHNNEIKGGAKYTTSNSSITGWRPVILIDGFLDKSTALSFEWRMKRKKNKYGKLKPISGLDTRVNNLFSILKGEIITSKCCLVSELPYLSIIMDNTYYKIYSTNIDNTERYKIELLSEY